MYLETNWQIECENDAEVIAFCWKRLLIQLSAKRNDITWLDFNKLNIIKLEQL